MAPANPLLALVVRLAPGLLLLQTAPAQSFGPQQALTPASANGANSVHSADLDGDGDADLLSASGDDGRIAWYENLGGGSFGPPELIAPTVDFHNAVYATDLDGDGDADVLSASTFGGIAWYENLGGGAFG
ncbi:MAG: VCBS repeat-containing protein, partial [Planctomycetota bacterium]|nr:VCBS repeat-containing protein [Planctomycetota bacterium]